MNIIERAIEFAGSQKALADKAKLSQPAIHKWLKGKSLPSAESAIQIERATEGRVKRYELRPDLFDPPNDDRSNAA